MVDLTYFHSRYKELIDFYLDLLVLLHAKAIFSQWAIPQNSFLIFAIAQFCGQDHQFQNKPNTSSRWQFTY